MLYVMKQSSEATNPAMESRVSEQYSGVNNETIFNSSLGSMALIQVNTENTIIKTRK